MFSKVKLKLCENCQAEVPFTASQVLIIQATNTTFPPTKTFQNQCIVFNEQELIFYVSQGPTASLSL